MSNSNGKSSGLHIITKATSLTSSELKGPKYSIFLIFFCFGLLFLSLVSRLIKITELLGNLTPFQVSLLLLSITIGDIVSSLTAGVLLDKYSTRKILLIFQLSAPIFLFLVGLVIKTQDYYLVLLGCIIFGLSVGGYNVAMNIGAVTIEKISKVTLMPRFHAFFSFGAGVSVLLAFLVTSFDIDILVQFGIVSVFALVTGIFTNRHIKDKPIEANSQHHEDAQSIKLKLQRLDWSIFLLVFVIIGSNLLEGSGEDWLPLGIAESFKIPENQAIAVLVIVLIFATLFRYFGVYIVDRFGPRNTIRFCYISGIIGLLICTLSPWLWTVYIGAIFWGIGASLAYPIAVSQAADDSQDAAFRTSIMATIGSILSIAAPPLFGFLGDTFGIRLALVFILPLLFLALYSTKVLPLQTKAKQLIDSPNDYPGDFQNDFQEDVPEIFPKDKIN